MDILKNSARENIFSKLQLAITLVLILFLSVTGATYAYMSTTATNIGTITGNMATVNLTLDVAKVFPTANSENTGVMVPQLSTSGSSSSPLSSALKSGCVDGNGNVVCQVYEIVIKNDGGTATLVVDGTVSFYSNAAMTASINSTMPNLKWKLIRLVDKANPLSSALGTEVDRFASDDNNVFADNVTMVTDFSKSYYMIIWIDETGEEQTIDVGKTFYASIDFNASNGTGVTATFGS